MKRIYITAIPLDSNFAIAPYAAQAANYQQTYTAPSCYPITPIIADTARPGDEITVLAVRQKNSPRSDNLDAFRRELDTLTFTQAMRTAVAKFDTTSGKEFLAYFDAIYSNALHENVNKQANRDQGDIGLSSREGKLWKRVLDLCDKQGLDARRLPAPFYKQLADSLGLDEDALRRLIRNATSARRTFSLNEDSGDNGPAFDMADPGQEDLQLRLERTTEAMRVIALFAGKDIKDYPRLFFTTDVLGPLCAAKPTFPPERYCALLEKQEDLLWSHIFVRGYIDFLFDPAHPARLRVLPDTPLAHPLRDSSVAAYQHVTPAAVSSQRKQYTALLHKMMAQMQG